MSEIRTARWVETYESLLEHPYRHRTEVWLRMSPPARAWRGEFIEGGSDWAYDVIDERGHLHTASTWDKCVQTEPLNPPTTEGLLREVMAPSLTDAAIGAGSEWEVQPVEEDGRALLRYERERIAGNFAVHHILWVDPETRRMVKRDWLETDLMTGRAVAHRAFGSYAYDMDLPLATFEMPPGKPIEQRSIEGLFPEVWDALSSGERQEIVDLMGRSDSAWLTGDDRAFTSAWRFIALPRAPGRRQWLARVREQKGRWREWVSEVVSVRKQQHVSVRIGASTFTSGTRDAETLAVRANVRVVWAEDGDTWQGEVEFYLRRRGASLRIVHWECPLEEIKAAHRASVRP